MTQAKLVLDKYHMYEYIVAAASHLKDSKQDAIAEIYRAIHKKKKWMAEGVFDKILAVTEEESKQKAVERSKNYILGNWAGIMLSMNGKDKNIRCSAEGHVSYVYSDRMSSRPLGWSPECVDKMARLRIYCKNGGDMLEHVRFQKEELPLAAGAESPANAAPWDAKYYNYLCPYCGSYKVRDNKWDDYKNSLAFWGIWSSKAHDKYKCDSCKRS